MRKKFQDHNHKGLTYDIPHVTYLTRRKSLILGVNGCGKK